VTSRCADEKKRWIKSNEKFNQIKSKQGFGRGLNSEIDWWPAAKAKSPVTHHTSKVAKSLPGQWHLLHHPHTHKGHGNGTRHDRRPSIQKTRTKPIRAEARDPRPVLSSSPSPPRSSSIRRTVEYYPGFFQTSCGIVWNTLQAAYLEHLLVRVVHALHGAPRLRRGPIVRGKGDFPNRMVRDFDASMIARAWGKCAKRRMPCWVSRRLPACLPACSYVCACARMYVF
jgi:hypothetical protein